jgi:hypothetical protein
MHHAKAYSAASAISRLRHHQTARFDRTRCADRNSLLRHLPFCSAHSTGRMK